MRIGVPLPCKRKRAPISTSTESFDNLSCFSRVKKFEYGNVNSCCTPGPVPPALEMVRRATDSVQADTLCMSQLMADSLGHACESTPLLKDILCIVNARWALST